MRGACLPRDRSGRDLSISSRGCIPCLPPRLLLHPPGSPPCQLFMTMDEMMMPWSDMCHLSLMIMYQR